MTNTNNISYVDITNEKNKLQLKISNARNYAQTLFSKDYDPTKDIQVEHPQQTIDGLLSDIFEQDNIYSKLRDKPTITDNYFLKDYENVLTALQEQHTKVVSAYNRDTDITNALLSEQNALNQAKEYADGEDAEVETMINATFPPLLRAAKANLDHATLQYNNQLVVFNSNQDALKRAEQAFEATNNRILRNFRPNARELGLLNTAQVECNNAKTALDGLKATQIAQHNTFSELSTILSAIQRNDYNQLPHAVSNAAHTNILINAQARIMAVRTAYKRLQNAQSAIDDRRTLAKSKAEQDMKKYIEDQGIENRLLSIFHSIPSNKALTDYINYPSTSALHNKSQGEFIGKYKGSGKNSISQLNTLQKYIDDGFEQIEREKHKFFGYGKNYKPGKEIMTAVSAALGGLFVSGLVAGGLAYAMPSTKSMIEWEQASENIKTLQSIVDKASEAYALAKLNQAWREAAPKDYDVAKDAYNAKVNEIYKANGGTDANYSSNETTPVGTKTSAATDATEKSAALTKAQANYNDAAKVGDTPPAADDFEVAGIVTVSLILLAIAAFITHKYAVKANIEKQRHNTGEFPSIKGDLNVSNVSKHLQAIKDYTAIETFQSKEPAEKNVQKNVKKVTFSV